MCVEQVSGTHAHVCTYKTYVQTHPQFLSRYTMRGKLCTLSITPSPPPLHLSKMWISCLHEASISFR
jgi:hypothetical protein